MDKRMVIFYFVEITCTKIASTVFIEDIKLISSPSANSAKS